MSNSKTQDIIKEYIGTLDFGSKIASYLDRDEVYAFEDKVGTDLFHFTPEQAKEMLHTFRSSRGGNSDGTGKRLSVASYKTCKMYFKALFQYYIENYEVVSNPFTTSMFKGTEWMMAEDSKDDILTSSAFTNAIQKLHTAFDVDKANYIECIALLYYNGIQSAEDIVLLKESDVDFNSGVIKTKRGFIRPSKRCFALLEFVNKMTSMTGAKYPFYMVSYRNSYFKFPVRASKTDEIDDRTGAEMSVSINKYIHKELSMLIDKKVVARDIFYLGLYDRMVADFGAERVKIILSSYKDNDSVDVFKTFLERNNIDPVNYSVYKTELKRYL